MYSNNNEELEEPKSHSRSDSPTVHEHVIDVASRVELIVPEAASTTNGYSVQSVARRAALLHDFGKLTLSFQKKLRGEGGNKSPHAPIGALAAYHVLNKCGYPREEQLAGLIAVAKHHQSLPNDLGYITDSLLPREGKYSEVIERQIADIDENYAKNADDILRESSDGNTDWETFKSAFFEGSLNSDLNDHLGQSTDIEFGEEILSGTASVPDDFYATVLQVWSAIILSDETSASGLRREALFSTLPSTQTLVDWVRELGEGTHIDQKRDQARKDVLQNLSRLTEEQNQVGTISLPTGLGKTLTGLTAAFKLRDEQLDWVSESRIVYALPFTSIIDQTKKTIQDIFDIDKIDSDVLTVHHHLSETRVRVDQPSDKEVDHESVSDDYGSYLLGEGWRSGMVTTTFVQLIESLVVPNKRRGLKLPSLYGSVIVLDEPQAIPFDWWPLVAELVRILTEDYGAYVLFMTATQPKILETGSKRTPDKVELVEDPDQYYRQMDRVEFKIHESVNEFIEERTNATPLGYKTAAQNILSAAEMGESSMAICNTVRSARTLHDKVISQTDRPVVSIPDIYSELLSNKGYRDDLYSEIETEVETRLRDKEDAIVTCHLTSRVRPRDRLVLISAVDGLLQRDVPVLMTATQVVEAGVDISFERVFRDYAPIDSLVQAAGRCNREGERENGVVTVWRLESAYPDNRSSSVPSQVVYGPAKIGTTTETLAEYKVGGSISESVMTRDAVNTYYTRIERRNIGEDGWVSHIRDGEFGRVRNKSLIDERESAEIVVVRTNEEWKQIREQITDPAKEVDFNEVSDYRVSIPVGKDETVESIIGDTDYKISIGDGIGVINTSSTPSQSFDTVYGFKK